MATILNTSNTPLDREGVIMAYAGEIEGMEAWVRKASEGFTVTVVDLDVLAETGTCEAIVQIYRVNDLHRAIDVAAEIV